MNIRKQNHRLILRLTTFLLLMLAFPASLVSASFSSPRDAGTGADVAGVGTIAWKNPDGFTSPGGPYAFSNPLPSNGGTTHYLLGTDYGFAIPTDAVIDGIVVEIHRETNASSLPALRDNIVQLVKGGVISGDNKAAVGTDWPTTFMTARYGGVTDLWGTTWTAEEINSSDFGVVLSITNPNPSNSAKGTLDWMRISVYYNLIDSTTTVECGTGDPEVVYGDSLTCVATVARLSGIDTPTGEVAWVSDGSGSFDPSPCTLSGTDGVASCVASFTPSAVGTGTQRITAAYSGDAIFKDSIGFQDVTVHKATPVLSMINSPVVYDGLAQGANVSGSVSGTVTNLKYDGSETEPVAAGSYAVTADFTPTDTANYETLTEAAAGDFVIEKATPKLSVTNSPAQYNGSPQPAELEGSVPGSFSNIRYNGSSSEPVMPGVYLVTAGFTPIDTVNNQNLTEASAGEFIIEGTSIYLPLIYK
ncbi:MAG: hypothetical protein A2Z16_06515 [Chloroflexi bacterium RBG_16_54_18]|nr:MAG: hypothetical protein A2Z16_06515 [Chloroflexi bacterium RBG_16_54_18]